VRPIKKSRANAGETLVEVVASIFIFLILMGILQGAITYSSNSLKKNKEIRSDNAKIMEALQNTEVTSVEIRVLILTRQTPICRSKEIMYFQ